jgi:hypothetical protein
LKKHIPLTKTIRARPPLSSVGRNHLTHRADTSVTLSIEQVDFIKGRRASDEPPRPEAISRSKKLEF